MFTGASSAAELIVIVGLPPDTMVAHELSRPAIQATSADVINVFLFMLFFYLLDCNLILLDIASGIQIFIPFIDSVGG